MLSISNVYLPYRFPIPDLRQEPHVDKSWYQRNLRDDVLVVDLEMAVVRSSFITGQPLEQVQISASDMHGMFMGCWGWGINSNRGVCAAPFF